MDDVGDKFMIKLSNHYYLLPKVLLSASARPNFGNRQRPVSVCLLREDSNEDCVVYTHRPHVSHGSWNAIYAAHIFALISSTNIPSYAPADSPTQRALASCPSWNSGAIYMCTFDPPVQVLPICSRVCVRRLFKLRTRELM